MSLCLCSLQGIPPLAKLPLTVRRFDRLPFVIGLYGCFIPHFVVFTHSLQYCNHTVWFAHSHTRYSFLLLSFLTHSTQLFLLFVFPCDIQHYFSCAVQNVSNNNILYIFTLFFCILIFVVVRKNSGLLMRLLFWVVYGTPLFLFQILGYLKL